MNTRIETSRATAPALTEMIRYDETGAFEILDPALLQHVTGGTVYYARLNGECGDAEGRSYGAAVVNGTCEVSNYDCPATVNGVCGANGGCPNPGRLMPSVTADYRGVTYEWWAIPQVQC